MLGRHATYQQKAIHDIKTLSYCPRGGCQGRHEKATGSRLEDALLRRRRHAVGGGLIRLTVFSTYRLEAVPLLKSSTSIRPVAIYEELVRAHPSLAPASCGVQTRKHDARLAMHRTSRSCTEGANKSCSCAKRWLKICSFALKHHQPSRFIREMA
jgi:hypothetical protein